jgi:hypothetical protein
MKNALFVVTCSILLLGANSLWSQEDPAKAYSFENAVAQTQQRQAEDVTGIAKTADQLAVDVRKHDKNTTFYEIVVISLVALISLIVVLRFIVRTPNHSASDIVHATGLIFIVYGTVFLSMTATTDQQLTAPIGILGAVAGYLFGQMKKPEE